jgi:hypothetical protein
MNVRSFTNNRGGPIDFAFGVDQVKRIEEVATLVALITSGVFIMTNRAFSLHEPVSKEAVVRVAIWLFVGLLGK